MIGVYTSIKQFRQVSGIPASVVARLAEADPVGSLQVTGRLWRGSAVDKMSTCGDAKMLLRGVATAQSIACPGSTGTSGPGYHLLRRNGYRGLLTLVTNPWATTMAIRGVASWARRFGRSSMPEACLDWK